MRDKYLIVLFILIIVAAGAVLFYFEYLAVPEVTQIIEVPEEIIITEEVVVEEEVAVVPEPEPDEELKVQPIQNGNLSLFFIDVGQGDSILIADNYEYALEDCGDKNHGETVVNFLKQRNITELKYLFTSHPDADHIGGCAYVLDNIKVETVVDNGVFSNTQAYEDYYSRIDDEGYTIARKYDEYYIGNSTIKVVYSETLKVEQNDNGIVLMVSRGSVEAVLTGDCTKDCENTIGANVDAEILKVGHHGSKSSTGDPFLNRIEPEFAVISVGENNPYGHPAQEVLERLMKRGIETFRTDLNGNVQIKTDGKSVWVLYDKPATAEQIFTGRD
ncbi:MBL fold metallo-hydrolase [Candidatus Micrarchaeota archaeon]|nr:MBL fold metallo-hydrolase [Candidatus Micrarchaeota archaeon]